MKKINIKDISRNELKNLLNRPAINIEGAFEAVKPMLNDIKQNGLTAALKYAEKYDGFTGEKLLVTTAEFDKAEKEVVPELKKAIETAAANIKKFHELQLPQKYSVETMPGVKCFREFRPIENVGLYIPGGSAVLFSTVLMLAIPAKIAGCKRIVLCSPVGKESINPALLYAAKVSGVSEFYKIGGAQAIGLMAYGDAKFTKVDKIFGPGNQYVTAAKSLVSIDPAGCAIDMPAGPSEVLVIADEYAEASFVAADLLSQAEHGADSQVILLTNNEKTANEILEEVKKQLELLPRKELAEKALELSLILIVKNLEQAFDVSNLYAPEHLIINIKEPERYLDKISNAGSVFIGAYSPESVGDYASGTNHSLPTYGYVRSFSGVSVDMFLKGITFQELTKEGLNNIAGTVTTMAEAESLQAHSNAVKIRLTK